MNINEICNMLRSELVNNDYKYGYYILKIRRKYIQF